MSLHPSLKTASGALNRHRNVLTRAERIDKLTLAEKFDPATNSALGLVKVRSIKIASGKKAKKAEADAAAAGGAAPAKAAAATGKDAGKKK